MTAPFPGQGVFEQTSGGGSGGGTVSGSSGTFVYRPGGVTSGNVYATWPALMAAMAPVVGPKTVTVDASLVGGTATVPAGGPYNLSDVTFTAFTPGLDTLEFLDGAHISPSATSFYLDNVMTIESNGATPTWTPNLEAIIVVDNASNLLSLTAAGFVSVANGIGFQLLAKDGSVIGDGTHPVAVIADPSALALVADRSKVAANAFGGTGAIAVNSAADTPVSGVQGITTFNVQDQILGGAPGPFTKLASGNTILQTQGGTLLVPLGELFYRIVLIDPAKGPFDYQVSALNFAGIIDDVLSIGYNGQFEVAAEPRTIWNIEQQFSGHHEVYWESLTGTGAMVGPNVGGRPFAYAFVKNTGALNPEIDYFKSNLIIGNTFTGNQEVTISDGQWVFGFVGTDFFSWGNPGQAVHFFGHDSILVHSSGPAIVEGSEIDFKTTIGGFFLQLTYDAVEDVHVAVGPVPTETMIWAIPVGSLNASQSAAGERSFPIYPATPPAGSATSALDTLYRPANGNGATVIVSWSAVDATTPATRAGEISCSVFATGGVLTIQGTSALTLSAGSAGLSTTAVSFTVTAGNTLAITFTPPAAYGQVVKYKGTCRIIEN